MTNQPADRNPAHSPQFTVVIDSTAPSIGWTWREIWRYRELLFFLAGRDVKVRYKQTVLGVVWAILQPLVTMLVFSLFFGRFAGLRDKTDGPPYPLYVLTALVLWLFFSSAVSASAASVVTNASLVTKVYFPRLVIPLASVLAGLVDLSVSLSVLLAMVMWWHHPAVSAQLLAAPIAVLGTFLAAAGSGTLLAALTVEYRDFRHVVPFILQTWLFLTPVIYPASVVPRQWRWILSLNPMAGMIDGLRAAFLGVPLDWLAFTLSLGLATLAFLLAAVYFQRTERQFADII